MYNDLPQTLKSTFFKILSSLPAGTYGAGLKKMILVFEANNVASLNFNFFFRISVHCASAIEYIEQYNKHASIGDDSTQNRVPIDWIGTY